MIGKLKGRIDIIFEDRIILDVSGVGYNIYCSYKNINFLQEKKDQIITILIETIVREDHIHLYGFLNEEEQNWFNELGKVSGVGNKVALKILGFLSIDEIIASLNSGDKTFFTKVPGIGPKLASRIVSELKDSAKKITGNIDQFSNSTNINNEISNFNHNKIMADAISALENLGYKRNLIYPIVSKEITNNPQITLETLITKSLGFLSKR